MRTLKYFWRLIGEFFGFAWQNKAWWIVPVVVILLLLALVIAATTGALPFIYTL